MDIKDIPVQNSVFNLEQKERLSNLIKELRADKSLRDFGKIKGLKITVPKKGGKTVKRTYLKQIVSLLKLEEWKDEN